MPPRVEVRTWGRVLADRPIVRPSRRPGPVPVEDAATASTRQGRGSLRTAPSLLSREDVGRVNPSDQSARFGAATSTLCAVPSEPWMATISGWYHTSRAHRVWSTHGGAGSHLPRWPGRPWGDSLGKELHEAKRVRGREHVPVADRDAGTWYGCRCAPAAVRSGERQARSSGPQDRRRDPYGQSHGGGRRPAQGPAGLPSTRASHSRSARPSRSAASRTSAGRWATASV